MFKCVLHRDAWHRSATWRVQDADLKAWRLPDSFMGIMAMLYVVLVNQQALSNADGALCLLVCWLGHGLHYGSIFFQQQKSKHCSL